MEQQNKVKILVAIHKPDKVYGDKVYMPIQVGKSLSEFNLGFQGDNTGDNITLIPQHYNLTLFISS